MTRSEVIRIYGEEEIQKLDEKNRTWAYEYMGKVFYTADTLAKNKETGYLDEIVAHYYKLKSALSERTWDDHHDTWRYKDVDYTFDHYETSIFCKD